MMLRHPEEFRFAFDARARWRLPTPNRVLPPATEGFAVNPYPYLVQGVVPECTDRADHPETETPQLRRPNILWYCSDQQRFGREIQAAYYTTIERIDDQFGRLLAAIEQSGQADNTVVARSPAITARRSRDHD